MQAADLSILRNENVERSLTVVLPVHEAHQKLGLTVEELLDLLPELTEQFEVLIVDNGSTEAASEQAHDLARNYPQVKVVHRGESSSREAAMRTGLEQSTGEVVFLQEDTAGSRIDDIHRLWRAVSEDLPACRLPMQSGYRLVRRAKPEQSATKADRPQTCRPAQPNYLARFKNVSLND